MSCLIVTSRFSIDIFNDGKNEFYWFRPCLGWTTNRSKDRECAVWARKQAQDTHSHNTMWPIVGVLVHCTNSHGFQFEWDTVVMFQLLSCGFYCLEQFK